MNSFLSRLLAGLASAVVLLAVSSCATPGIALRPVHNEVHFSGPYLEVAKCDTPPRATRQVAPQYPIELRRAGYSGEAVVWFIVETDGRVSDIQVQDASSVEFGEAARAAISQWRFVPGKKGGEPVRVLGQINMPFTLSQ